MVVELRCDWAKCPHTTDPDLPYNWFIVQREPVMFGERDEVHFCSAQHLANWMFEKWKVNAVEDNELSNKDFPTV